MEVNGQLHEPVALSPGKQPPVSIWQEVDGAPIRSGRCDEEKNWLPQLGIG
jgi:hypothetical protein